MNEEQIRQSFIQFLKEEKGYPSDSILVEVPIIDNNAIGRYRADLLLLDTRIGEYIGLIEFKNQINTNSKTSARRQISIYLSLLRSPSLPAYLITPSDGQQRFNILIATEDEDWTNISVDQFPEFETLSAKKFIEEKEQAKFQDELKKELILRRRRVSYMQSLVVLITIIASILTVITTFNNGDLEFGNQDCDCEQIEGKLVSLKMRMDSIKIQTNISTHIDSIYIVDSTNSYCGINKRISIIENGISSNPEKTLSLVNMENEIRSLENIMEQIKEINIVRIESLITRIEWLNALVSGIIFAIFGASAGFLLTNYFAKNRNTDNNT
jgi:hypothetical protein